MAVVYDSKNQEKLDKSTKQFLDLMDDVDRLLATREEFLLGKWLNDAKSWGKTESEKRLYEANARNLITAWGRLLRMRFSTIIPTGNGPG